jgi:hypothetical protein
MHVSGYCYPIPLHEQTLADRERILGPDHPDALTSRNNLAETYGAAGRAAEAIPLSRAPWPTASGSWAPTIPKLCSPGTISLTLRNLGADVGELMHEGRPLRAGCGQAVVAIRLTAPEAAALRIRTPSRSVTRP